MLRFSRIAPVGHAKSVENPRETRSVSEGLFAFSNKPPTRRATNSSASRESWKRNLQGTKQGGRQHKPSSEVASPDRCRNCRRCPWQMRAKPCIPQGRRRFWEAKVDQGRPPARHSHAATRDCVEYLTQLMNRGPRAAKMSAFVPRKNVFLATTTNVLLRYDSRPNGLASSGFRRPP